MLTESAGCMNPPSVPRHFEPEPISAPSDALPPERAAARPLRRLARFAPDIVGELPDDRLLRLEVNGRFAGTILAIPDAPRELAVGWSFMYGFFDLTDDLGCVTVAGDRVSVMVESGEDVDVRRLQAVGWAEAQPLPAPDVRQRTPFRIGERALLRLIDTTWDAFRRDGAADGYHHVAATSGDDVHCIARDLTADMAVAKVLGWMILHGRERETPVLVVRGIVDRRLIEAAARLGISMIITSAIPTVDAFRAAAGLSLSIVGMALTRTAGLLVDSGHIEEQPSRDDSETPGVG